MPLTSSTHAEDDAATLQMRLRNGALVSSMFSFGATDQDRIEIFGDRAILRVDRYLSTACEIIPRDKPRARVRQLTNALSFLWQPRLCCRRGLREVIRIWRIAPRWSTLCSGLGRVVRAHRISTMVCGRFG